MQRLGYCELSPNEDCAMPHGTKGAQGELRCEPDRRREVVMLRATDIAPCPRLERASSCLAQRHIRVLALGWDREARFPETEVVSEYLEIRRLRIPGRYGAGWRNVLGLLHFNVRLLARLLSLRALVVHAIDLDTALPALMAKWAVGSKLVYDIADWYAASRRLGILAGVVERLERWVVRYADYVLVADEARLEQLGGRPQRWAAIYNSPPDSTLSGETGLPRPYFAYVGILHGDRGIEHFSASATRVGVPIVVAGYGPLEDACRATAAQNSLVRFVGRVPYAKGLAIQAGAAGILALYDPRIANNRMAAPNKLYEAMMVGKPIITSEGTLIGEIVKQEGIGLVIAFGSPEKLAAAMRYLVDHPEEARRMGSRARVVYEQRYSYEVQCRKLLDAYRAVAPSLFSAESGIGY